jgi:hypothetical protein
MLPNARITSVLAEVDRWTGFSGAFTHLHTGLPADDPRVVLTAVLADATNLGLTRMADACSVASYRKLAWTAGWHLREDTYRQALAILVNAQQRQPACRPVRGRRRVQLGWPALSHRRAGRGRGRDQRPLWARGLGALLHAPLWPPRALPHRGDPARRRGRPRHRRPALPRGGPQHRHPSHGWGWGVRPRVRARASPRLPVRPAHPQPRRAQALCSRSGRDWPALAPFIAGHPDDKRITAHWDDVLRLATSVRTGVISASLMLKRLGAYPRQNGLALALREIGRIERTLYTLDWLEHPSLRRQATAELNKGESRNALARAVCFHRLGRLRDRTAEAQQHRASGLALVTAAIALWNTVYLGRALDALRRRGEARCLMRCSPTSRRSAGSTSTSRAITSGAPTPTLAQTGSGRSKPRLV